MHHPAASSSPAPWASQLAARVRCHLLLKALGITAFTWLFFIAYFHLLRHPAYPTTTMPLTALDRLLPLQPALLPVYFSLWIYVGFAPTLQRNFVELVVYGLWVSALCITGLVLFYFWPTAVPARLPEAVSFPGFALMQGADAAGNACPSMHVAVAIFSALCLDDVLRRVQAPPALRGLNAAWLAAIVYSTLAVKQHVALDALAGALLGCVFALAALRWRPGRRPATAGRKAATDIIGTH